MEVLAFCVSYVVVTEAIKPSRILDDSEGPCTWRAADHQAVQGAVPEAGLNLEEHPASPGLAGPKAAQEGSPRIAQKAS